MLFSTFLELAHFESISVSDIITLTKLRNCESPQVGEYFINTIPRLRNYLKDVLVGDANNG